MKGEKKFDILLVIKSKAAGAIVAFLVSQERRCW